MARIKTIPDGMVVAYCGCHGEKRENLLPQDLVDGTEMCLACGRVYTMTTVA